MRHRRRYRTGFTLIEVTLGLTILILIFGVIFQLVQFSVMGANAAAQASLRSREVSGLFALVRQLCLDLPVNSQLAIENRGGRKGYELVITNAPVAIFPEQYDGVRVLGFELRKAKAGDGKELWLVESLTRTNTGKTEKPEVNEFRLMEDVKGLKWEAGDSRNQEKMNRPDWNEPVKPAFLRLTLERQTGKKTFTNTALFWIPAGMSPTGQAPVDPVTRSLMATTNSTNPTVSPPTP
jgi:type II secretory pathway pseudopilin PulG